MKMIKVYVTNAHTAPTVEATDELITEGFAPISTVLMYSYHMISLHGHTTWMILNSEWMQTCDAILNLKGYSPIAEEEVEEAREIGIPVFYTIEQLKEFYGDSE